MFWNTNTALKLAKQAEIHQQAILAILQEDQQKLQFTPDYKELCQHRSRFLFVHDDMAQLQPNHPMVQVGLSGFYPLAYGYTSRAFQFVKKDLGLKSFPIALDMRETGDLPMYMADKYRIRGEIYAIRPETFISLDTYKQNGVQFVRQKVNVNIGFQKQRRRKWFDASGHERFEYLLDREEMISQEMFMYVGREEYWRDQLNGFFDFKPIPIIQEDRLWLREYYQYSKVR